ncbi:MAG TPA: phage holin family protein [Acidimicrobiales bacterium]|nr:phage holin family protein [Acidimicrobiales bacterium]
MTVDPDLQDKSTAELLKTLSTQVTALVHQEVELAKAELADKTKKFGVGAGIFGAAGVVGILAGATLVAAAVAGIATALSVWLSILIVGAFLAAVAGVLALTGITELAQGAPPIPQEALESTKEDVAWLKTQARSARP